MPKPTKEQSQGNVLIAEKLMSATFRSHKDRGAPYYRFEKPIAGQYAFLKKELRYHDLWDGWLMAAVDKIESLYEGDAFTVVIKDNECFIKMDIGFGMAHVELRQTYSEIETKGADKKEATYLAVIEFTKWFTANITQ